MRCRENKIRLNPRELLSLTHNPARSFSSGPPRALLPRQAVDALKAVCILRCAGLTLTYSLLPLLISILFARAGSAAAVRKRGDIKIVEIMLTNQTHFCYDTEKGG